MFSVQITGPIMSLQEPLPAVVVIQGIYIDTDTISLRPDYSLSNLIIINYPAWFSVAPKQSLQKSQLQKSEVYPDITAK